MTSRRLLLALPAVAAVAVLTACGSDPEPVAASPATSGGASSDASSGAAPSSASTSASTDGGAPDIRFEDQTGPGDSALVARVDATEEVLLVVRVDDDDAGDDGTVLGVVVVGAGTSTDVQVPLDPALTAATDLEAALYLDSNGDGSFDSGDQPVAEPDDDNDDDGDDGDDVVSDGADYRVA